MTLLRSVFLLVSIVISYAWIFKRRCTSEIRNNRGFVSLCMTSKADAMSRFENYYKNNRLVDADYVEHSFSSISGKEVRGLRALKAFKAKEAVATLPKQYALTAYSCAKFHAFDLQYAPKGWKEVWDRIKKSTHRLAIMLLIEYLQGDQSPYAEYINFLPAPNEFRNPLHWNSEILAKFPYQYVNNMVKKQNDSWKELYSLLQKLKPDFTSQIPYDVS